MKFVEMEYNSTYEIHALLEAVEERTAKNGEPYVRLNLSDGSGKIVAQQFGCSMADLGNSSVFPEHINRVKLKVGQYNGDKSYTIEEIANADNEVISIESFVQAAPIDLEKAYVNMLSYVYESDSATEDDTHKHISEVAAGLLEEYEAEFKHSAAGQKIHHNVIGGLLYHTSCMVEVASKLCDVYPSLDRELLVCGAALHDIGKLFALSTSKIGRTEYTPKGRMLGHTTLGVMKLQEFATSEYDPERVLLLQHMLAAHHGLLEYGAVSLPALPEAAVLHAIDMIDSRVHIFDEAYRGMEPGTLSRQRINGLGAGVYKPAGRRPEM